MIEDYNAKQAKILWAMQMCKINVRYKSNAGTEPYEVEELHPEQQRNTHMPCHAIANRDFQQNLLELE